MTDPNDITSILGEFVKAGGWGIMVFLLLTGNLFTKAHVADLRTQILELTNTLKSNAASMDRMADAWEARNKAEQDQKDRK